MLRGYINVAANPRLRKIATSTVRTTHILTAITWSHKLLPHTLLAQRTGRHLLLLVLHQANKKKDKKPFSIETPPEFGSWGSQSPSRRYLVESRAQLTCSISLYTTPIKKDNEKIHRLLIYLVSRI